MIQKNLLGSFSFLTLVVGACGPLGPQRSSQPQGFRDISRKNTIEMSDKHNQRIQVEVRLFELPKSKQEGDPGQETAKEGDGALQSEEPVVPSFDYKKSIGEMKITLQSIMDPIFPYETDLQFEPIMVVPIDQCLPTGVNPTKIVRELFCLEMQLPTHGVVKTNGHWDTPRVVMTLTPANIPQHNPIHPEQADTDVWQVVRLFIDKNEFSPIIEKREFSSVTEKTGILAHYNNMLPRFSDFPTPEE